MPKVILPASVCVIEAEILFLHRVKPPEAVIPPCCTVDMLGAVAVCMGLRLLLLVGLFLIDVGNPVCILAFRVSAPSLTSSSSSPY